MRKERTEIGTARSMLAEDIRLGRLRLFESSGAEDIERVRDVLRLEDTESHGVSE